MALTWPSAVLAEHKLFQALNSHLVYPESAAPVLGALRNRTGREQAPAAALASAPPREAVFQPAHGCTWTRALYRKARC